MSSPGAESDQGQPLIEHLLELRSCLLKSVVVTLVIFLGLFAFANDIYEFISAPLQRFLPEESSMIATDVTAPFLTPFKMTLYVAIYLAVPFILFQLWTFIGPALYKKEKRVAIPILISSIVLFYLGTAFAYFVVFPLVFKFFTSIGPESVVSPENLAKKRPYVIVFCFVLGMLMTPPDVISQLLLAIPMWLLFEAGLFFGKVLVKDTETENLAN